MQAASQAHQLMQGNSCAILTIAGSDSSGGAGIQADLKTITALKCYGASVITALTAQNTVGVQAIHPAPPDFVEEQIRSVLGDIQIEAIKTGMLFDAATVHAITRTLRDCYRSSNIVPLVCDPVCVSTSGHILLQEDAVDTMIDELFPLSKLITPNRSEAELILSRRGLPSKIANLEDMLSATENLLSLGPEAVLLKGGHVTVTMKEIEESSSVHKDLLVIREGILGENMEILEIAEKDASSIPLVADVLLQSDGKKIIFPRPHLDSKSTHGTGCTLSAALACELGRGASLVDATISATSYTHLGIETAAYIGKGCGPLDHTHSILLRKIPPRTITNPHPFTKLLINTTAGIWKEYVEHEFVKLLGKGTLSRESFLHFIKQDYHYLKYYARAYGLLAAKSHSFSEIASATGTILHIVRESSMHKSFCAQWGITDEELENTPESPALTAYGAYLIDVGLQGDNMKLVMALAACLLGYGEVGLWLKKEANKPNSWVQWEGNPYLKWMEDYTGEDYQNAVKLGLELIESRAAADPPSQSRFDEWRDVWERCTRLEKGFWDMAMNLL